MRFRFFWKWFFVAIGIAAALLAVDAVYVYCWLIRQE